MAIEFSIFGRLALDSRSGASSGWICKVRPRLPGCAEFRNPGDGQGWAAVSVWCAPSPAGHRRGAFGKAALSARRMLVRCASFHDAFGAAALSGRDMWGRGSPFLVLFGVAVKFRAAMVPQGSSGLDKAVMLRRRVAGSAQHGQRLQRRGSRAVARSAQQRHARARMGMDRQPRHVRRAHVFPVNVVWCSAEAALLVS